MSVNRGRAITWFAAYRGQTGQWVQLLHRVSGLGVLAFLLLHVIDTSVLGWGPQAYNALANFWHQPVFRILQVGLLAALLFHSINGIRITIVDFWDRGSLYQEKLFWATVALFLVLFVPGAWLMVAYLF